MGIGSDLRKTIYKQTKEIAIAMGELSYSIEEFDRTEASKLSKLQNENAELRELAARAWRLFTENGAVHPNDLPEVDAVRDGLRKLGVKVDLIND